MRSNAVKRKLREGGVSIGTFIFEFATTGIARIVATAGAEFAVFDTEHTGWSLETVRTVLATVPPALVSVVRVPATEYHFIARVLDLGAMGIMVPMVESVEQAQHMVQYAKYPPPGRRGAAFGLAHDNYADEPIVATMSWANSEQLLIAQIETAQGVKHAEEIAGVEGIDVLWIGHLDLTNSLGIPGEFHHPRFHQAIETVLQACKTHGKVAGFMCRDIDDGRALLEQGFRMISYSGDLWLYKHALRQGVGALTTHAKTGLGGAGSSS